MISPISESSLPTVERSQADARPSPATSAGSGTIERAGEGRGQTGAAGRPSPKSVQRRLLDGLSSIWFGVAMLILIFLYSSIGSAVPLIRQGILADWLGLEFLRFEKTEMEWFAWWPFQLMVLLFCLALILVTLRRIRLSVVNLGVWAIHGGIIIMTIACFIYFGFKVEGDAAIFHSRALLSAPGMEQPVSLVMRPQAAAEFVAADTHYQVSVANMVPNYEIFTGPHKGARTHAIWLNVRSTSLRPPPTEDEAEQGTAGIKADRHFIRLLLLGYPEYTEDVIQGHGGSERALKAMGQRLLDHDLDVQLTYDPVDRFHVMDTVAIYARFSPTEQWKQLRVKRTPRYFEHLSSREGVILPHGQKMPRLLPLDLKASAVSRDDHLDGIEVRVTDFLPYAVLEAAHSCDPHSHHAHCDQGGMQPRIIARHQRQPLMTVGQHFSLIRAEVNDEHSVQSVWLPFNRYAMMDAQRSQPNRFIYAPASMRLSDGRTLELMYSRWSKPLPAPVALDRFVLQTYPGGDRPSDYISLVRFWEEGQWSPLLQVRSNNPAQHGRLWYFQSQWDPGTEAHTVLGVGNREGVHLMIFGVLLSIAGMSYAFYFKPVLIHRRKAAALAAAQGEGAGESRPPDRPREEKLEMAGV